MFAGCIKLRMESWNASRGIACWVGCWERCRNERFVGTWSEVETGGNRRELSSFCAASLRPGAGAGRELGLLLDGGRKRVLELLLPSNDASGFSCEENEDKGGNVERLVFDDGNVYKLDAEYPPCEAPAENEGSDFRAPEPCIGRPVAMPDTLLAFSEDVRLGEKEVSQSC